jgi:hypothetical protein
MAALRSIALRALVLGAIGGAVAAAAPQALSALFTIGATAHKTAQASLLPSLGRGDCSDSGLARCGEPRSWPARSCGCSCSARTRLAC